MTESQRSVVLAKATVKVRSIRILLKEVSEYLDKGEELPAIGALSGVASQVQYVETLLTVLRDLETNNHQPPRRDS